MARAPSRRRQRAARRVGAARTASTSACSRSTPRASSCCCSTTRRPRSRRGSSPLDAERAPHLSLLACLRARVSGRARSMPIGRTGRSAPERGLALRRRESAARSVRPGRRGAGRATTATPRAAPATTPPTAMKSVVADPGRYDWEGDRAAAAAVRRNGDLRAARPRLHPPSQLGRRRGEARHLCRTGRKDPVPRGPRRSRPSNCCRCFSSIRRMRRRPRELLGLPAGLVLRAASRLQLAADPLGVLDEFRDMVKALHRAGIEVILDVVFNHTTEGGAGRPDALLSRARERRLLHPRRGPVAVRRLHRLRQHAERQPADRAPADPGQPALLGHARCTSTASASTSRRSCRATKRAARCRTRPSCGTSNRIRCSPAPS